jgi:hypothetical protein
MSEMAVEQKEKLQREREKENSSNVTIFVKPSGVIATRRFAFEEGT